jgi:hypothetical protein
MILSDDTFANSNMKVKSPTRFKQNNIDIKLISAEPMQKKVQISVKG